MKFFEKTNLIIISIAAVLFAQLGLVSVSLAQELPNPLKATSFEGLVKDIAEWLYIVAIPLCVIVILYAAFLFLTSGGDEERVKKAKRTLTWAIVGIAIIIIGAGFITLIKDILQAP